MRLNLQIDDALLQEASRLGSQQTPQLLVLEALREYIQCRQALKALIAAEEAETRLCEWDGLVFIEGTLTADISNVAREEYKTRISTLLARI